jgi:hypothetical protein
MMDEEIDYEEFWEELLADIEEHRVVPIIGPDLVTLPMAGANVSLYGLLAQRLAEKLRIDIASFNGSATLNDVASAFVSRGGRREEIYPKLRLIMREIDATPSDTMIKLASIGGFELFIALTFDSLLVDAINQARFSGDLRTLQLAFSCARTEDLPRDWDRAQSPAVYHLLGKLSAAPEYAVTDEDVLEFVTSLQSQDRRPSLIFDELRASHLLLIGASFPDWLARFFLRLAKDRQLSLARSEKEILIDPTSAGDAQLVRFVRNFSYGTKVIGLEPKAFVDELHQRWTDSGRASLPAPRPGMTPAAQSSSLGATEGREAMRPGSVFLSYAREDLRHVLDLKAAFERVGVDAWLDKERLEAGDLYDQKIRRFIKTCAVFVPVISQNTERRVEGYFRREWKLAAERAQGIAEQIPFVLPVVVDDTPEYGASVPECFLAAQWTRIGGSDASSDFERRVATIVRDYRQRTGVAA